MLAQVENIRKTAQRSRHTPRKSVAPTSSQDPSSEDAGLSADISKERHTGHSTRILRRGDTEALPSTASVGQSGTIPPQTLSPHTPPRPKSMYAGSADKQQACDGSAPESSRNKRKSSKSQASKQLTQVSAMPMMNDTSTSTPRRDPMTPRRDSVTPKRSTETPSKAYAGPTFHASPAASSLPLPKFYSKSVPNVDKTKSLKTMMEQEDPDSSSGSEESPAVKDSQHAINLEARVESPLDIFFRADREAKGRTGSMPNVPCGRNSQANGIGTTSGPQTPQRLHSCSHSVGGMFALELDGAAPEELSGPRPSGKPSLHRNSPAPVAVKSNGQREAEREEQRKAQTIALKKLLYSPTPQVLHNNSTGQRPPSSKLRKELSMPTSPEQGETIEFPGTPTPSRIRNPTTPANYKPKQQDGHASPLRPFTSESKPDRGHNVPFPHDSTSMKFIEDDLRRILKMDALAGDGITGLRS